MNNKKIIIFLCTILVIFVGFFMYMLVGELDLNKSLNSGNNNEILDDVKEKQDNFDIYTSANKIQHTEILDDKDGVNIYYYYMDTCGYCNSIKDQVTDLYLATEETDGISMKFVDMKSTSNSGAWAQDNLYDPTQVDMTDVENIKIIGTPTMIYVVDGEVVNYQSGGAVFEVMEAANSELSLNLEFDPSKYGE